MQRGVHGRLMDNSTSVREAAVELLGRFVLSRPQLTEQYYDMLIERILVSPEQRTLPKCLKKRSQLKSVALDSINPFETLWIVHLVFMHICCLPLPPIG